jgi:hypothetical protein
MRAEQAFAGNESLVAQAALENRVLQLDDLPPRYLKVSSGLGDAAPRHVLIVPVVHEGLVNGVVELGFLRALSAARHRVPQADWRQRGHRHPQRAVPAAACRTLLAETQQLNEELQVQQEELRTANEELEEQSRALQAPRRPPWRTSRPSWSRPMCQLSVTQASFARPAQRGAATCVQARPGSTAHEELLPRQPLQVGIPREHVARAAHAAQQRADPGQAPWPTTPRAT